MSDKLWKLKERQVAAIFLTVRNPLSGRNSRHGTSSDTLHPSRYIESRFRRKCAVVTEFLEVERKAKLESKVPVLVISLRGKWGKFAVVRAQEYARFLAKAKRRTVGKRGRP